MTGHTFDIDARVLPHRRGVEPVNDAERWPDIEGPLARPRPAKPFVGKDGKPRPAAPTVSESPDDGSRRRAPRNSSTTEGSDKQ